MEGQEAVARKHGEAGRTVDCSRFCLVPRRSAQATPGKDLRASPHTVPRQALEPAFQLFVAYQIASTLSFDPSLSATGHRF